VSQDVAPNVVELAWEGPVAKVEILKEKAPLALPAVVLTYLVPRSKTLPLLGPPPPPLPMACIRYYGVVLRDVGSWVGCWGHRSPLPRMQPPMHAHSGSPKSV
jgi:hypothetical protein